MRAAEFPSEPLLVAAGELRGTAATIAAQLLVVSKLPLPKRQRALLPLRRQVDDVEKASLRIAMSSVTARGHTDVTDGLRILNERLDHLDAARSELRDAIAPKSSDGRSNLRDRLRRRG